MKTPMTNWTIFVLTLFAQTLVASSKFENFNLQDNDTTQIAIDTSNAKAFYISGLLFLEQKKYKDAINNFDKAIELNPEYAEAFNERANAKSDIGYTANEKKSQWYDYDKAISINPKFAKAYFDRGVRKCWYENMLKPTIGCPDICKSFELGYPKQKHFFADNCDCSKYK